MPQASAVGLLCLRKAREGGLSTWSSQITAHNEMLLRGRKVDILASLHSDLPHPPVGPLTTTWGGFGGE